MSDELTLAGIAVLVIVGLVARGRPAYLRDKAASEAAVAPNRARLNELLAFVLGNTQSSAAFLTARPPSLLGTAEAVLLCVPAAMWQHKHVGYRNSSVAIGGLGPTQSPLIDGVLLATAGSTRPVERFTQVDTGSLTLTSRRLLFLGRAGSREILLDGVIEVTQIGEYLCVSHPDHVQGMRFVVDEVDLIASITAASVRRSRQGGI